MKKLNLDLDGIIDSDDYNAHEMSKELKNIKKKMDIRGLPKDIIASRKKKNIRSKAKRKKDCGCK